MTANKRYLCNAVQFSDQMSCSCGNVWDMNDPCPPECKKEPTMTTNKPLFRFSARVVESDPTGYYMTRWDRAQSVTVIAHNNDEAFEKVRTMMGDPTRHSAWAVRIDSAEEIVNDNQ